jgi:WhiB family redox-sensing transcriptional regulator
MAQVSMWDGGKGRKLFSKFDLSPPEWHRDAACGPDDTETFSPADTDTRESVHEEIARIRKAKQICRSCPVVTQCLTDAYENEHEEGIWGGESEYERPYTDKAAKYRAKKVDGDSREVRVMRAVQAGDILAAFAGGAA